MDLNRRIILASIGFAVLVWIFHALADALLFYRGSVLSLLLFDIPPHDLFIRTVMVVIIVGFGVTAGWLIGNLESREADLQLFRSLIDEANDSVFVLDPQTGDFLDVNQEAADSLGYDRRELLEKNVADVSSFADSPAAFPKPVFTADSAGPNKDEVWHTRADGSEFPVEISAKSVDIEGERYGLAIARDITERKERERHLRTLIGNLPGIAYRCDHTVGWPMELVQGRSEELVGYTTDEIESGDVSWGADVIHPEDRRQVQEQVAAHVEKDEPFELTYRVRTKDGEEKWVWEKGRAVSPFHRQTTKLEGFITDISDQKQLEQRLSVANRILRHDIRSAVNVIQGNAELARSAERDPSTQLQTIQREAERLNRLGENARIIEEAVGGAVSETETMDLVPMLEAKLFHLKHNHPAVQIVRELPESAEVEAAHRLGEAVQNVLDNAVFHNDQATPEITVAVNREVRDGEDWIAIEVRDNGPGIPVDEIEPILDGEETALKHTSGLGLWVVKWIVEGSGGQLEFSENDPRGSVVRLRLPPAAS